MIDATNLMEGYHRQLRKMTKGKSIFPTDESLTTMLYLATMEVTQRIVKRLPVYTSTEGTGSLRSSLYFNALILKSKPWVIPKYPLKLTPNVGPSYLSTDRGHCPL
ncbi:hypothetical protein ALPO108162_13035 [Alicyclobacillus pomorum]